MVEFDELALKLRAVPCGPREEQIAHKYGFKLPAGATRGQFFELLGQAMKRQDPKLGVPPREVVDTRGL